MSIARPGDEEATHRGVKWRRSANGRVSFYDADGRRWLEWTDVGGAPPLPPKWSLLGRPTKVTRPGWKSWWRIVPVVLVAAAVVVAVVQAERPSGNAVAKETAASAALLAKCLPQVGVVAGHPSYSSTPVACTSVKAAVRIVEILPPGSPLCPAGTTGIELPYPGVANPHVECAKPV